MEKDDKEKDKSETIKLTETLQKLVNNVEEMKKYGLDGELLEIYIHHKTKLSMENVRKMLGAQNEFIERHLKSITIKALQK